MSKGVLYVVSAPSGCGKGTILETVLRKNKNIYYSVSATTRSPRDGEIDNVNYYFHSKEEFEKLLNENGMLEHAVYCDNFYGTPRKQVEEKLEMGYDVILEIETKGAMQVKDSYPDAVFIFILPPSMKELRRRLEKRRTESEEIINKRLAEAVKEIKCADNYDFIMINDKLEQSILNFEAIIKATKLFTARNLNKIDEVLENA